MQSATVDKWEITKGKKVRTLVTTEKPQDLAASNVQCKRKVELMHVSGACWISCFYMRNHRRNYLEHIPIAHMEKVQAGSKALYLTCYKLDDHPWVDGETQYVKRNKATLRGTVQHGIPWCSVEHTTGHERVAALDRLKWEGSLVRQLIQCSPIKEKLLAIFPLKFYLWSHISRISIRKRLPLEKHCALL